MNETQAPPVGAQVAMVSLPGRFDLKPAERYGTLRFIVGHDASPFASDEFAIEVLEGLENIRFDPDRDFFALTGPAATLALGYAVALCRYRRLRTLIFDARADGYQVRVVEAPE